MHSVAIDILRSISAFFIVGRHVGLNPATEMVCSISEFCDTGVAVFALISGYFMFKPGCALISLKDYCHRRIVRLLPLYIGWTLFYIGVRIFYQLIFKSCIDAEFRSIRFAMECLFLGKAASPLWYIIDLLYCQLLLAAIFYRITDLRKHPLILLASAFTIIGISYYVPGHLGYYLLRLMAFVVAGIAVRILTLNRIYRLILMVTSVCGYIVFIRFAPKFYCDAFLAIALLSFALSFDSCQTKLNEFLRVFAGFSFGVYLLHPFFIIGIRDVIVPAMPKLGFRSDGILTYLAVWTMTYFASLTATFVLVRLRMSKLVGCNN